MVVNLLAPSMLSIDFGHMEDELRTAINAGADMVYVSSDFETTYQYLLDSINDGAITEERLNDALVHIYTMKKNAM